MIDNGYYPSHDNNNKNKTYNLSIIQLLCKIILFDYIGPISLSNDFITLDITRLTTLTVETGNIATKNIDNLKTTTMESRNVILQTNCALHLDFYYLNRTPLLDLLQLFCYKS